MIELFSYTLWRVRTVGFSLLWREKEIEQVSSEDKRRGSSANYRQTFEANILQRLSVFDHCSPPKQFAVTGS